MALLLVRVLLFLLLLAAIGWELYMLAQMGFALPLAGWLTLAALPGFLSMSFLFTVFMLFPIGFLLGANAALILIFTVPMPAIKVFCALFLLWLCYDLLKGWFSPGKKWTLEELENNIAWAQVGPEEMPLVEKMRSAKRDFEIKIIAQQLIKRGVLVVPDEGEKYGFGHFLDDWRVYAGFLLKAGMGICFFSFGVSAVSFIALMLGINVFAGLAGLAQDSDSLVLMGFLNVGYLIAVIVGALGAGATLAYYVCKWMDTSTWPRLLLSWLIVMLIVAALGAIFIILMLPVLLAPVVEALQTLGQ